MGAKLKSDDNDNDGCDSEDEDYNDDVDDQQEESNSDNISSDEEDEEEEKKTRRNHTAKKPKMSPSPQKQETKRTVEKKNKDEPFHEMDSSDEERVEEEALKNDKWLTEDYHERFCAYPKDAKRMDEIEHEQRVLQLKEKQKKDREQRFVRRQRK